MTAWFFSPKGTYGRITQENSNSIRSQIMSCRTQQDNLKFRKLINIVLKMDWGLIISDLFYLYILKLD